MEEGAPSLWEIVRLAPLKFEIPGHPPSVNELYATVRGRRVKTSSGRRWEVYSAPFVRRAALETYGTCRLGSLKGKPISLELTFYRDSWVSKIGLYKRPDVSNFIKAAEDSIMEALGLDDSAVCNLTVRKEKCGEGKTQMGVILEFI